MRKIVLKFGDRGTLVSILQSKLGLKKTTLFFGNTTKGLVEQWQKKNGLAVTGEVDLDMLDRLGIENPEKYLSTDVSNQSKAVVKEAVSNATAAPTAATMVKLLSSEEYFQQKQNKFWIVLHHTAGGHNPTAVVSGWENDTRGRIATEFIIGNKSTSRKDNSWDGVVVKCMPDGSWAYHLGDNGNSKLHPQSIGIEICNYGWVTKGGYKQKGKWVAGDANKFYTYVGSTIPEDQVVDLGYDWRGYRFWHKYTDAQISSLRSLIIAIARANPQIDIKQGLQVWLATESSASAFGFKESAYNGSTKGIITHGNIRKDKTDCSPQPNLVDMIKNLRV